MNLRELYIKMAQIRPIKKKMLSHEYYCAQNELALKKQKTGLPQTDNFELRYAGLIESGKRDVLGILYGVVAGIHFYVPAPAENDKARDHKNGIWSSLIRKGEIE